jgi:hypothetical protein
MCKFAVGMAGKQKGGREDRLSARCTAIVSATLQRAHVMAGHSLSKNGVASLAYVPANSFGTVVPA